MATINVVQYNILCQKLVTPEFYPRHKVENLNDTTRFERLKIKLDEFIKTDSIICLQEVSQSWSGRLHDYFAKHEYSFVYSLYGNAFLILFI